MHDASIILLVGIFLLQEVKGENGRHNKEKCNHSIEYAHETFETRVIGVEDYNTLIRLKIHLKQLLERDGQ